MIKEINISSARLERYLRDAETVGFYRRNPIIACEDLLGIYLSDAQAWMIASSWNTSRSVWSCTRNFGKSFLIVIYCLLRAILYPNQNIYIVSSVGNQAKETFNKLEEIVLRLGKTSESIPDLKDIAAAEVVTNPTNKDGFKHDPSGYSVTFYNGSRIETLNSKPSNTRGKRSSLTVFDEAAYCSEDLIDAVEPFSTQSSDSKYGKNTAKLQGLLPSQPPNQIIYASSQDTLDAVFYKRYKEYAKYMLAGDFRYFVCDMPCDTAITMYSKGEVIPPLLSQDVVDKAMRDDPETARKEYYNKPDMTGGDDQIVKWYTIRKNERQIVPYQEWREDNRIVLAFDPARTTDNSVMSVMNVYEDPEYGLCGDIIGCNNFIDIATKKKYKLDSNRQLEEIRNILLAYNGDNLDYEYIDSLLIDSGSGGGGRDWLPL